MLRVDPEDKSGGEEDLELQLAVTRNISPSVFAMLLSERGLVYTFLLSYGALSETISNRHSTEIATRQPTLDIA